MQKVLSLCLLPLFIYHVPLRHPRSGVSPLPREVPHSRVVPHCVGSCSLHHQHLLGWAFYPDQFRLGLIKHAWPHVPCYSNVKYSTTSNVPGQIYFSGSGGYPLQTASLTRTGLPEPPAS